MKNKVELKKAIIKIIFITLLTLIALILCQHYQYRTYTLNFNNKIGSITSKIAKDYPNININELMEIINSENDIDEKLFRSYGIDLNKDAILLNNDKYFITFLVSTLIIMFIFITGVLIVFFNYNNKKNKKIREITKYIEEINNGNYKLDIEDNTEDELSILKNELYKTTIMLKEVAENSVKDKTNLKKSLSDISHQLKTPLTSITVMLDDILDNPDMNDETRADFIKNIKKQVININFLVNSLLKLSKLDVNAVNFINNEEYIEDIIKQSINNVSILCDLKNVKIDIKDDTERKIYCDAKWQIEAISNILKNGVEHSKENGKIDIFFEENKLYFQIKIKDYGIGIDKNDLPHIFERFYKGKNSSNDSIGIGLALSKAIIEKNNGSIDVSSELNKGTEFIIRYYNDFGV